jgi:predicted PurR-regulated permease PerM
MVFLMYYFLTDGGKLVSFIRDTAPLPEDIQQQLYEEVNMTTWAVIKGHVLVAVVQGLLAGLGLALTGVPNYIFWTSVMIILAFIPIIGTFMVWGPAAAYLFLIDEPLMAVLLALYGLTVVALSDNFLRPFAVDRGTNLHPAVILIGVIGGVYLFGASGLFLGPIMLGIFKSVLLVFKNSYKDL